MPHSLRAQIKNLCYKKMLTEKERDRVIKALDIADAAKQGVWLDYSEDGYVECPFCGYLTTCNKDIAELHYCFNCGAKMVEPQESEAQDADSD